MGLDIRWPIGLMFALIGLLLVGTGLFTSGNAEMYHRSLDININIIWGTVLVVFGGLMIFFARAARAKQAAGNPPQAAK